MSEINPYRDENIYDTPQYRLEIIAEYDRLLERREYIASEIIRLWPLREAVELPNDD